MNQKYSIEPKLKYFILILELLKAIQDMIKIRNYKVSSVEKIPGVNLINI